MPITKDLAPVKSPYTDLNTIYFYVRKSNAKVYLIKPEIHSGAQIEIFLEEAQREPCSISHQDFSSTKNNLHQ